MNSTSQQYLGLETASNTNSPPIFPYAWASVWGEDRYGLWVALDYLAVRHRFRWIMPGSFWMGSPGDEKGRYDWEDRHRVTISRGFWLGETVVTQALWQAVMDGNPSHFKGDDLPVERVSWDDIQRFIAKLNLFHLALKTRLPWEAEWEYACRAGSETPFHFADELSVAKVNYRGTWEWKSSDDWGKDAKQSTTTVRNYPCNDWGLYDMHGNVWEWCADDWREHLGAEEQLDPWLRQEKTEAGGRRVVRGGSWIYDGGRVRSAYRYWYVPGYAYHYIGFRLALGH